MSEFRRNVSLERLLRLITVGDGTLLAGLVTGFERGVGLTKGGLLANAMGLNVAVIALRVADCGVDCGIPF